MFKNTIDSAQIDCLFLTGFERQRKRTIPKSLEPDVVSYRSLLVSDLKRPLGFRDS
jgi:hypothetical protein